MKLKKNQKSQKSHFIRVNGKKKRKKRKGNRKTIKYNKVGGASSVATKWDEEPALLCAVIGKIIEKLNKIKVQPSGNHPDDITREIKLRQHFEPVFNGYIDGLFKIYITNDKPMTPEMAQILHKLILCIHLYKSLMHKCELNDTDKFAKELLYVTDDSVSGKSLIDVLIANFNQEFVKPDDALSTSDTNEHYKECLKIEILFLQGSQKIFLQGSEDLYNNFIILYYDNYKQLINKNKVLQPLMFSLDTLNKSGNVKDYIDDSVIDKTQLIQLKGDDNAGVASNLMTTPLMIESKEGDEKQDDNDIIGELKGITEQLTKIIDGIDSPTTTTIQTAPEINMDELYHIITTGLDEEKPDEEKSDEIPMEKLTEIMTEFYKTDDLQFLLSSPKTPTGTRQIELPVLPLAPNKPIHTPKEQKTENAGASVIHDILTVAGDDTNTKTKFSELEIKQKKQKNEYDNLLKKYKELQNMKRIIESNPTGDIYEKARKKIYDYENKLFINERENYEKSYKLLFSTQSRIHLLKNLKKLLKDGKKKSDNELDLLLPYSDALLVDDPSYVKNFKKIRSQLTSENDDHIDEREKIELSLIISKEKYKLGKGKGSITDLLAGGDGGGGGGGGGRGGGGGGGGKKKYDITIPLNRSQIDCGNKFYKLLSTRNIYFFIIHSREKKIKKLSVDEQTVMGYVGNFIDGEHPNNNNDNKYDEVKRQIDSNMPKIIRFVLYHDTKTITHLDIMVESKDNKYYFKRVDCGDDSIHHHIIYSDIDILNSSQTVDSVAGGDGAAAAAAAAAAAGGDAAAAAGGSFHHYDFKKPNKELLMEKIYTGGAAAAAAAGGGGAAAAAAAAATAAGGGGAAAAAGGGGAAAAAGGGGTGDAAAAASPAAGGAPGGAAGGGGGDKSPPEVYIDNLENTDLYTINEYSGGTQEAVSDIYNNNNNNEEKIGVMVAGNSGLPGGGVGRKNDVLGLNYEELNKSKHKGQEESIVSSWLKGMCIGKDPVKCEHIQAKNFDLIKGEWGFESFDDKNNYDTIQGVNYVTTTEAQDYGDAWVVRDARLKHSDNTYPVNLFFVAGPNASNGRTDTGSMNRTRNEKAAVKGNYDFFKECIMAALRAGLDAMIAENITIAIVAGLSTGIYAGVHKRDIEGDFKGLLKKVLDEKIIHYKVDPDSENIKRRQFFKQVHYPKKKQT